MKKCIKKCIFEHPKSKKLLTSNNIILKKLLLAILLLASTKGRTQTTLSKAISVLNENDLFVSTYYDRYYTNGLFVSYRYADPNLNRASKTIHEFQVVHKMYTPQFHKIKDNSIDRPYAGYAFLSYKKNTFNKNNALITGIELGAIGPVTKAAEIQNTLHQSIGYAENKAWKNQIQNKFAINIEASYLQPLSKKEKRYMDFIVTTTAKIGTIHSHASASIYSRINLLKTPLSSFNATTLLDSNLYNQPTIQQKELFIYLKPQINYTFYNATIQGTLPNEARQVDYTLIPLNIEMEIGIKYAFKRMNLSYAAIRYSKTLEEMIEASNTYGAIKIAYLFD